jgi:tRNA nucleotidyltransferase/poly(A) polymerase
MDSEIRLTEKLEKKLPPRLVVFLQLAGRKAGARGAKAYIVGGVVRELLLGVDNYASDLTLKAMPYAARD